MSKEVSGATSYFEVLRSMGPSSRLQAAIQEAERVASVNERQRARAAQRAVRNARRAKAVKRSQGKVTN